MTIEIRRKAELMKYFLELLYHVLLVLVLYSSYIARLLWHHAGANSSGHRLQRIHFPATADPAPLLYPILLPLFAVLSLNIESRWVMLVNLSLSLSCVPTKAIPLNTPSVHWLLSLAPLAYARPADLRDIKVENFSWTANYNTESLSLLFPLHSALASCIGFLSTTSLLPTELQLLSVSSINVLMFSTTPQSVILKALLWIGGLSVFILCKHVLHWSVGLARVPSWRFRRVHHRHLGKSALLCAIDDTLGGWLSKNLSVRSKNDGSDSEEDRSLLQRQRSTASPRTRSTDRRALGKFDQSNVQNFNTADDINHHSRSRSSLGGKEDVSPIKIFRQRRHTLPTSPTALPNIPELTKSATAALSKLRNNRRPFLSLTQAQARVMKWLYALHTYAIMLLTILLPIRIYIGKFALRGREPIGWALGYLLGDLHAFRLQVLLWNLDHWIQLPKRISPAQHILPAGEHLCPAVLGAANTRLLICTYCLTIIAAGLFVVFRLSAVVEVDTRRKVFHGMMVAMFLPTIPIDPPFVALAFVLVLAIFLLLDLFRASQLPPLSKPLTYFLAPYVDGRDHRGPIIVSHIFLLIGCAIPLWLSLAATERIGEDGLVGWDVATRDLSMISGVICVGMGDAAASLVGRRFGRRRWPWSGGKSLEGSAAFAAAVVAGIMVSRAWMLLGGWEGDTDGRWTLALAKATVAAVGASLTEAVLTGGNDNVIVPVVLWLLMRGLRI